MMGKEKWSKSFLFHSHTIFPMHSQKLTVKCNIAKKAKEQLNLNCAISRNQLVFHTDSDIQYKLNIISTRSCGKAIYSNTNEFIRLSIIQINLRKPKLSVNKESLVVYV